MAKKQDLPPRLWKRGDMAKWHTEFGQFDVTVVGTSQDSDGIKGIVRCVVYETICDTIGRLTETRHDFVEIPEGQLTNLPQTPAVSVEAYFKAREDFKFIKK